MRYIYIATAIKDRGETMTMPIDIEWITDPEIISIGISVFSILTLILGFYYLVNSYNFLYKPQRYLKDKNDEIERKFIKAVQEGLKKETIGNARDILRIYEAIIHPERAGPGFQEEVASLLKRFILFLSSEENNNNSSEEVIKKWSSMMSGYITKLEEESPYSDLPDAERNILIDMQNLIETNDKEAIKRKISEIAKIIRVRTTDMVQMVESNKRANLYAKIGVVLTILFGIISLILTLKQIPILQT